MITWKSLSGAGEIVGPAYEQESPCAGTIPAC